jgi:tRNA-dihydrouridine synthase
MKRITRINELVSILREETPTMRVSLKLRLGLNDFERKQKTYLSTIRDTEGVDYYILHARHGKQTSADPPSWDAYRDCVREASNKIIIANGDIDTLEIAQRLKDQGVHGVMLGRVAVRYPTLFQHLRTQLSGSDGAPSSVSLSGTRLAIAPTTSSLSYESDEKRQEASRLYDGFFSYYYSSEAQGTTPASTALGDKQLDGTDGFDRPSTLWFEPYRDNFYRHFFQSPKEGDDMLITSG